MRQLSFGLFTLDRDTRELLHGPERQLVHVSPKAYDLLCLLIEARPAAIAKRDLHERLWPSSFVSDATLASLITELRVAMGERGRGAGVIRTVHGYGYAFSGSAHETVPTGPAAVEHWVVCGGRETPLLEGEHVIGRDGDVAVLLTSPTVSRRHAKIAVVGSVATVHDLESKNGTYVHDARVTAPVALADGDQIRIGAFQITYRTASGRGSTETAERPRAGKAVTS